MADKDKSQPIAGLIEVGNPIRLNHATDPFSRITNKVRTFMSFVDLIPCHWELSLQPLFNEPDPNNPNKGGIQYAFDNAIANFQNVCGIYGLKGLHSGVRILSTSETISQEDISNNYEENFISKSLNAFNNTLSAPRDVIKSFGSGNQPKSDAYMNDPSKQNEALVKAYKTVNSKVEEVGGQYGKAMVNLLTTGRQISLPQIWKGVTYAPSLSLNIRLVSPYGAPRSIQKHVLEPLLYLLILSSPKTNDGITYGGNTPLKIRAYGVADINLGAISSISIKRGGSDVTFNKHGQPLFVDVTLNIVNLLPGFACLEDDKHIKPTMVGAMQNEHYGYKSMTSDFGFCSLDNIIKSFEKFPDSDNYGTNGSFPKSSSLTAATGSLMSGLGNISSGANSINGFTSTIAGGVTSIAGSVVGNTVGAGIGIISRTAGATGLGSASQAAASVASTVQSGISTAYNSLII